MDLDDLLEDLWEDAARDVRARAEQARGELARRRRMPGLRRRLRTATLYGSAGWFATFGGLGIATQALAGSAPGMDLGTFFALLFGGLALPAVGSGLWAWRSDRRETALERERAAAAAARRERAELPADVMGDWVRLRKAQALVTDLAGQGLVAPEAAAEAEAILEDLRPLLVADRRAAEIGAEPSRQLRAQLSEVADLLVALAVEGIEHRSTEVTGGGAPATLLDGHDRLRSLRDARSEIAVAERGGDAVAAAAWIEQEVARRGGHAPDDVPPPPARRRGPDDEGRRSDDRRQQPG